MTFKLNEIIGVGETYTKNLRISEQDGTPVDLTGHNVRFVRKSRTGAVLETVEADLEGNTASVEIEQTWPVGKYAYHMEHQTPDGEVKWMFYGALTVTAGGVA